MDVLQTEQYEGPRVNFVREGIKIGLINGAISMALLYGGYFMGMETFVNLQFITKFIPYMMIILIVYGLQLRRQNGYEMSFKEGLQYAFVSYVIAALVMAIGTYILFNLIDKDLTQKTFDIAIEKTRSMMEKLGQSDDQIDKAVTEMEKGAKQTSLGNIIIGMGQGLIWDFVVSCIVALIIKKEKPAF